MPRSEPQVLKAVTNVNERIRTLTEKLEAAWVERRDLYAEARSHTPPIPHARIAAAAGTTEAAVMQVVAKGNDAALAAVITERIPDATPAMVRAAIKHLSNGSSTADALTLARTMPMRKLRAATT
jgi:hypothetical protein